MPEKSSVTKPPEPVEKNYGGQVKKGPVEEKEKKNIRCKATNFMELACDSIQCKSRYNGAETSGTSAGSVQLETHFMCLSIYVLIHLSQRQILYSLGNE